MHFTPFILKQKNHVPFYTTLAGGQKGRKLDADSSHKVGRSKTAHLCISTQSFCPKCHYPAQRIKLINQALFILKILINLTYQIITRKYKHITQNTAHKHKHITCITIQNYSLLPDACKKVYLDYIQCNKTTIFIVKPETRLKKKKAQVLNN